MSNDQNKAADHTLTLDELFAGLSRTDMFVLRKNVDTLVALVTKEARQRMDEADQERRKIKDDWIKLRKLLKIIGGVLASMAAIFGYVSWTAMKADVVTATATKLSDDPRIRQKVVEISAKDLPSPSEVQTKIEDLKGEVTKLDSAAKSLETRAGSLSVQLDGAASVAADNLNSEIKKVREMLEQIRGDFKQPDAGGGGPR